MTLAGAAKEVVVRLGMLFRVIGEEMQPDYWVCNNCSNIEYSEREVICWKCGEGEMIYKGDLYDSNNNSRTKRSSRPRH